MTILIGFLTVLLVLNCVLLILLILIQLPKKEAGIGMAFGGAATETLFGAGSGTLLTKATKYCAGIFMGLSLLLAIVNSHISRRNSSSLDLELQRRAGAGPVASISAPTSNAAAAPAATTTPVPPAATTSATPGLLLTTNAPAQ